MADFDVTSEQDLFHACLERPAAEWQDWLSQACPDPLLCARVLRLVEAHRRAGDWTPQPLVAPPAGSMPDAIGPYVILGVLGEGGMGIVYDAEQIAPVRRRVALKVVKVGMDTRQVVARFLAERQALAAMDHPFVAKVLDAGETVAGRPYFVMERVEGEPLLEYCSRTGLALRQRLNLFVLICRAVQHAHQKGVIHRDLKPSNLLVTESDAGPAPKVIDFGIAKAIAGDETGTALTRVEQRLGTPAYMSPEQAAGADVDTRSDIYALGVILYELLTGVVPTDPREVGESRFLARLAAGEIEPPHPSARVADGARLPEDLDWIVMKALAVDRAERYDTAASLADDLSRHLRDETVTARPPTASYRARKFVRRHRVPVAAAVVAGVALVAGSVAAGLGFLHATRAEAIARQEAATAEQVSTFLTTLFGASDPNARGTTTLRDLLDRAAARIGSDLKDQPAAQSNLYVTLAHVYASLGVHAQAAALAEQALEVQKGAEETVHTAEALLTLGRSRWQLGKLESARESMERALALRARLEVDETLGQAEILTNLGGLYGQLERHEEAIQAHTRALEIQRRLRGPDFPRNAGSLRGIAIVYARQRKFDESLELNRQALAVLEKSYGPNHVLTAGAYLDVANDLADLERPVEALTFAQKALEIRKAALGPDHPQLAFVYGLMGELLADERPDEARKMLEESLRIRETALGSSNPRTAESLAVLGQHLARLGEVARARAMLERALRIYRQTYPATHSRIADTERKLAAVSPSPRR